MIIDDFSMNISHNLLILYRKKGSTDSVLILQSQRRIMRHVYRFKHRKQKQKAAQIRRIKYFLAENPPEAQSSTSHFFRLKKHN